MADSKGETKQTVKRQRVEQSTEAKEPQQRQWMSSVPDDVLRRMFAFLSLGGETTMSTMSRRLAQVAAKTAAPADIPVQLNFTWMSVQEAMQMLAWAKLNKTRVRTIRLTGQQDSDQWSNEFVSALIAADFPDVRVLTTALRAEIPAIVGAWKDSLRSLTLIGYRADNRLRDILRLSMPHLESLMLERVNVGTEEVKEAEAGTYDGALKNLRCLEIDTYVPGPIPFVSRIRRLEVLKLDEEYERPSVTQSLERVRSLGRFRDSLREFRWKCSSAPFQAGSEAIDQLVQALAELPHLRVLLLEASLEKLTLNIEQARQIVQDHKELTHVELGYKHWSALQLMTITSGLAPQLEEIARWDRLGRAVDVNLLAKWLQEHPCVRAYWNDVDKFNWKTHNVVLTSDLKDAKSLGCVLDRWTENSGTPLWIELKEEAKLTLSQQDVDVYIETVAAAFRRNRDRIDHSIVIRVTKDETLAQRLMKELPSATLPDLLDFEFR